MSLSFWRTIEEVEAGNQNEDEELLFDRYRVLDTRGKGGFGEVNVCWDTRLQRRVAIKHMNLASAQDSGRATLDEALREARTASLLAHPNIVSVFDFISDDTDAYLVMEYVDGLSLHEILTHLDTHCLTFDEVAYIMSSIGSALAFAHENGVLHLDIKPQNIMIDKSGNVKLLDFGMATLASATGFEGARGGTVGYMPPEQLRGELVDERTDLFSFATVMYQALTGTNPYLAKDITVSLKHIEKGAELLEKTYPALQGTISDAFAYAMQSNIEARPISVEAFYDCVCDDLGNKRVGRQSLKSLLLELCEQEEENPASWEEVGNPVLPFSVAHENLPIHLMRIFLFICCVAIGWITGAHTHLFSHTISTALPYIYATILGACALFVPQFTLVVFCILLAVCFLGAHITPWTLLIVILLAIKSWFIYKYFSTYNETLSIFSGTFLQNPFISCSISCVSLTYTKIIITSIAAFFLQTFCICAWQTHFASEATLGCLLHLCTSKIWLLQLIVLLITSVLAGIFALRKTKGFAIIAQLLVASGAIFVQCMINNMENASIWTNSSITSLVIALCCIGMMIWQISLFGTDSLTSQECDNS